MPPSRSRPSRSRRPSSPSTGGAGSSARWPPSRSCSRRGHHGLAHRERSDAGHPSRGDVRRLARPPRPAGVRRQGRARHGRGPAGRRPDQADEAASARAVPRPSWRQGQSTLSDAHAELATATANERRGASARPARPRRPGLDPDARGRRHLHRRGAGRLVRRRGPRLAGVGAHRPAHRLLHRRGHGRGGPGGHGLRPVDPRDGVLRQLRHHRAQQLRRHRPLQACGGGFSFPPPRWGCGPRSSC